MIVFCRKHRKFERVVGFSRDDPVLSCGEVKERTCVDDRVMECRKAIDRFLVCRSLVTGREVSEGELADIIFSIIGENEVVFG
jgi:hypothetical protein